MRPGPGARHHRRSPAGGLESAAKTDRRRGHLFDLSQIAQEVGLESRIPTLFETSGKPFALDQQVERDLLMVAREALHNSVRHAHPGNLQLRLCFERRKVRMYAVDDGCGFEPASTDPPPGDHYGLVGMRERALLLGGRFEMESAPGQGTRIAAEIPVTKR